MEKYSIDYINIHRTAFLLNAKDDSDGEIFSELSALDIESCVFSSRLNTVTVILLPNKNLSNDINVIASNIVSRGFDCFYSDDFAFVEIGGHFVGGSGGLVNVSLDILRRNKINIEYQILSPSRYSFLIKPNYISRLISSLITNLGVRDSMVSIY